MAQQTVRQEAGGWRESADFSVLVGWSHRPFHRGIDLQVESVQRSGAVLDDLDQRHYLMTRNQALILAKYLLEVTGQELPERRQSIWQRLFGRKRQGG